MANGSATNGNNTPEGTGYQRVGNSQLHIDLGALSQKVSNQEGALAEFKTATIATLSSISQQINALSQNTAQQISSLAQSMEVRMRTPWTTLFTGLGAIATVFVFFVIGPVQRDIERLDHNFTNLVASSDHRFEQLLVDERNTARDIREGTVSWREHSSLIQDLRDQRATLVTREEHKQHWDATTREFDNIRSDIKRIDSVIGSQYNGGDLLRDLNKRVHDLETENTKLKRQQQELSGAK